MNTLRCRGMILAAVLGFYLAIPNARPDFTRFNAHDSEYYMALSHSLVHGRGYTRSLIDGMYIPHTTWPPGVPMLLMPAMAVGGERVNWLAVKWTIALVGVIGIVFSWLLVRRISDSYLTADLAALAVGLNPYYWDFSHQAMAEVPLTVWVIGSLLMIDRLWANRRVCVWEVSASGFLIGLGMLIKGHAIGVAVVPLAYLIGSRRSLSSHRHQWISWMVFLICFSLPMLTWLARNRTVHAEGLDGLNQVRIIVAQEPTSASSSMRTIGRAVNIVVENVRYYFVYQIPQQIIPGLWPDGTFKWSGSGIFAVALAAVLIAVAIGYAGTGLPLVAVAAPITALNLIVDHGGAPRYWVPVTMVLSMLIALRVGRLLVAGAPRFQSPARLVIGLVLALNLAGYVVWHERNPYNPNGAYGEFVELAQIAHRARLHTVGILVPGNPHAFQLMTGLPAPMKSKMARFSHVVVREDVGQTLPAGSKKLFGVYPWALLELPRLMSYAELVPDEQGPDRSLVKAASFTEF